MFNVDGYKSFDLQDLSIKADTGDFTCYGNVKNIIDHAQDRTVDGAFQKSISEYKQNGTSPKMFWNHQHRELPVGKWLDFEEDSKGLLLTGRMSQTQKGQDILTLMKENEINQFSIGYIVMKERWNQASDCNDLIELDIKEISPVVWACNEASTLQSIQKSLHDGELLSKSDLRKILQFADVGLSKRQIENITARYSVESKEDETIATEIMTMLELSGLSK